MLVGSKPTVNIGAVFTQELQSVGMVMLNWLWHINDVRIPVVVP